jgi:hypothetical protein
MMDEAMDTNKCPSPPRGLPFAFSGGGLLSPEVFGVWLLVIRKLVGTVCPQRSVRPFSKTPAARRISAKSPVIPHIPLNSTSWPASSQCAPFPPSLCGLCADFSTQVLDFTLFHPKKSQLHGSSLCSLWPLCALCTTTSKSVFFPRKFFPSGIPWYLVFGFWSFATARIPRPLVAAPPPCVTPTCPYQSLTSRLRLETTFSIQGENHE